LTPPSRPITSPAQSGVSSCSRPRSWAWSSAACGCSTSTVGACGRCLAPSETAGGARLPPWIENVNLRTGPTREWLLPQALIGAGAVVLLSVLLPYAPFILAAVALVVTSALWPWAGVLGSALLPLAVHHDFLMAYRVPLLPYWLYPPDV